jgi:hypothetical protein
MSDFKQSILSLLTRWFQSLNAEELQDEKTVESFVDDLEQSIREIVREEIDKETGMEP